MTVRKYLSRDEEYALLLFEGKEGHYLFGLGVGIDLWEIHGENRLFYCGLSTRGKYWVL